MCRSWKDGANVSRIPVDHAIVSRPAAAIMPSNNRQRWATPGCCRRRSIGSANNNSSCSHSQTRVSSIKTPPTAAPPPDARKESSGSPISTRQYPAPTTGAAQPPLPPGIQAQHRQHPDPVQNHGDGNQQAAPANLLQRNGVNRIGNGCVHVGLCQ